MPESNKQFNRYSIPAVQPANPHITRLTIRKSRFLTQTCHCPTDASARDFISQIRAANPDATHNCWAYAAGAPGDTARIGSSDDGEPHGSAGRPMLNALLHCGTGEICVVVSRWFGGIKLGVGGLVRAYQDAVLQNLETLPLSTSIALRKLKAQCGYEHLQRLQRIMPQYEASITGQTYGADVILELEAPDDRISELTRTVSEETNGQCMISLC